MLRRKTRSAPGLAAVLRLPSFPSSVLAAPVDFARDSRAHGLAGLKLLGQPTPPVAEASLPSDRRCYPVQMKQKDKPGRPDMDQFETAMRRAKWARGFVVSWAWSDGARREIQRFFGDERTIIVPLTVPEILAEQIASRVA